jgi:hypothetical protein
VGGHLLEAGLGRGVRRRARGGIEWVLIPIGLAAGNIRGITGLRLEYYPGTIARRRGAEKGCDWEGASDCGAVVDVGTEGKSHPEG